MHHRWIDKDPIRDVSPCFPPTTMSTPSNVKWLGRFKRDLETCAMTIPSPEVSAERENVVAWAVHYVKVKVGHLGDPLDARG